jgi:uncharacterized protein (DUF2344 family)
MDVVVAGYISPHAFTSGVGRQLPPGIEIVQAYQIAPTLPSLQSQVRYAEYLVEVKAEVRLEQVTQALSSLLSRESLPWQHQRDTGPRSYDLRRLIDDLWLNGWQGDIASISMRLRCAIHRTRLILKTS